MRPLPSHRPVNQAHLLRDLHVKFTIEVLRRIGVPPRGSPVSGRRIASEALGLSEDRVESIWKERIWERPFAPVMRKHSKSIAERNGPFHTAEA